MASTFADQLLECCLLAPHEMIKFSLPLSLAEEQHWLSSCEYLTITLSLRAGNQAGVKSNFQCSELIDMLLLFLTREQHTSPASQQLDGSGGHINAAEAGEWGVQSTGKSSGF